MPTFTNSGLVTFTQLSPCNSGLRTHAIDTITIHCVVGQLTAAGICGCFANSSAAASCNYGIGTDGSIGLCVEEKNRSWCSSSQANDQRAITIECASDMTHPYAVNDTVYKTLIKLVADICYRNGIKELKWKADKSLIGQTDKQNMTVHRWFKNKACPGDYLYSRMGDIANQVNKMLKNPNYKPVPGTSAVTASVTGDSSAGSGGYVEIPVNMDMINENLDYYIVTLDRFSKIPDIKKLIANRQRSIEDNDKIREARTKWNNEHMDKDGKVTEEFDEHAFMSELREKRDKDIDDGKLTDYDTLGFIVEAGYYFDDKHNVMNSYYNPQLKAMMSEIKKYGTPYGFFAVTRAKNEQEARDEIDQLRYVFANYPTSLGFWLVMDLPYKNPTKKTIEANDKILEVYKHYLVDYYGFVQKMGLYATAEQMKAISWAEIQDDWFLWLVDHVEDLDEFLHPQTTISVNGGVVSGGISGEMLSVNGVFDIPAGTQSISADQWKLLTSEEYLCIAATKYLTQCGYKENAIIGVVAYMLGEGRHVGFVTWQSYWLVGDPEGHKLPFAGGNIPVSSQCFGNQKWKQWLNPTTAWKVDPSYGSLAIGVMSQTDQWSSSGTKKLTLATEFLEDAISHNVEWQSPGFQCMWIQKMTTPGKGTYSYLGDFVKDATTYEDSAEGWCSRYTGMFAKGAAVLDGRYLGSIPQARAYVQKAKSYQMPTNTSSNNSKKSNDKSSEPATSSTGKFKKYSLSEDKLKQIVNLCNQEQGSVKGSAAEASLAANILETNSIYKKRYGDDIYSFMRNSGWFAHASRYMDGGKCSDAQLNAVRDVLINGKRTLPLGINEHDCFSDIIWAKNGSETIDKRDRSAYKKNVTKVHTRYQDSNGYWTFYCFPAEGSDPFGYTPDNAKYMNESGVYSATETGGAGVLGGGTYTATIDFLTPQFFMLGDESGEGISDDHDTSVDPPGMGKSKVAQANSANDGKKTVNDGSGQGNTSSDLSSLNASIEALKEFLQDRFNVDYQGAVTELRNFFGKDLTDLNMDQAIQHLQDTGKLDSSLQQSIDKLNESGVLDVSQSMKSAIENLQDALKKLEKTQGAPDKPDKPVIDGSSSTKPSGPDRTDTFDNDNWGPKPDPDNDKGDESIAKPETSWGPESLGGTPEPPNRKPDNWGPGSDPDNPSQPDPQEPSEPTKLRKRILLECARFELKIQNDRSINDVWRYKTTSEYDSYSLRQMIDNHWLYCNEHLFVNWMLQNIGVLDPTKKMFMNTGSGIKFEDVSQQTNLYNGCDFISMPGTILSNILDMQSGIIPGDIILFKDSKDMQIYAGNNEWYDGGSVRCISGIYVWLSGRATYLDKEIYGVLRLKEEVEV